jgi:hypothetical protein
MKGRGEGERERGREGDTWEEEREGARGWEREGGRRDTWVSQRGNKVSEREIEEKREERGDTREGERYRYLNRERGRGREREGERWRRALTIPWVMMADSSATRGGVLVLSSASFTSSLSLRKCDETLRL